MKNNKTLMDVDELADYLGVHKATVYRHVQKGKIPGFKIGADWRFHRRSIDKWIKQKEQAATDREAVIK